jgi:divalent metal cation (Fe/Co/Zn/Cd) transporter
MRAKVCLAAFSVLLLVTATSSAQDQKQSIPGIVLTIASLIIMPLLVRSKRNVARGIKSGALMADSKQTELCTYLSAILLAGLLLNALVGRGDRGATR